MNIYDMLRVTKSTNMEEIRKRYGRTLDSYELVATFAEDNKIREIAKKKIDMLKEAGREIGLTGEVFNIETQYSEQNELAQIRMILNSSNGNPYTFKNARIVERLDRLPESAEKHYLIAILSIRVGHGLDDYSIALTELQSALRLDPTNKVYSALVEGINNEILNYEENLKRNAVQAERERKTREERSRQLVRESKRNDFFALALGCISSAAGCIAPCLMCYCCAESC